MERHISFCCDDNYLIPACIMLESLMRNNKGIHFIAHTFTDDLSESSIRKFESILRAGGCELVLHKLPEHSRELIANAPTLAHISIATYYRLFLPYVTDESVKTVLYLDCDIMIRGSVEELFKERTPDTLIVGAPDINEEDHANRIGVDKYVNTGVLTMNLAGIRQMYTIDSMLDGISKIMDQPEKILLGDQDIINLLFKGHIVEVPVYYNFQRLIHKAYCLKNPSLIKKVVIAHFITGDKPWNNDYLIVFAREYYSYLRKYLTPKQRAAWWLGKPKGVVNMFQRHRKWTDLQKQGTN
jgi:lipopolysaccharide biosynthesis glycosyltransferase